jgi:hypothetical protein
VIHCSCQHKEDKITANVSPLASCRFGDLVVIDLWHFFFI